MRTGGLGIHSSSVLYKIGLFTFARFPSLLDIGSLDTLGRLYRMFTVFVYTSSLISLTTCFTLLYVSTYPFYITIPS